MNCKPGDLAVIVSGRPVANIGKVVQVISFKFELMGCHIWKVEGSIESVGVADDCLRPLRNPGDDAVDESKAWLPPVPLTAIEPSLLEKT